MLILQSLSFFSLFLYVFHFLSKDQLILYRSHMYISEKYVIHNMLHLSHCQYDEIKRKCSKIKFEKLFIFSIFYIISLYLDKVTHYYIHYIYAYINI